MAKIQAGTYTVSQVFQQAGFDFDAEAASEGRGPDFRRVRIGGLGFDSLEDVIVIPETADKVAIVVDDKEHTSLNVSLSDEQKQVRELAFQVAADAGTRSR